MSYSSFGNIVFAVGRTGANGVSLLGTATLLNSPGKFVTAAHVTNKDEQNLVVVVKPDNSSINDTIKILLMIEFWYFRFALQLLILSQICVFCRLILMRSLIYRWVAQIF